MMRRIVSVVICAMVLLSIGVLLGMVRPTTTKSSPYSYALSELTVGTAYAGCQNRLCMGPSVGDCQSFPDWYCTFAQDEGSGIWYCSGGEPCQ